MGKVKIQTHLARYHYVKCSISITSLKNIWIAWLEKILAGKRCESESRHLHLHFCNIRILFSHKCFIF